MDVFFFSTQAPTAVFGEALCHPTWGGDLGTAQPSCKPTAGWAGAAQLPSFTTSTKPTVLGQGGTSHVLHIQQSAPPKMGCWNPQCQLVKKPRGLDGNNWIVSRNFSKSIHWLKGIKGKPVSEGVCHIV